MSTENFVIGATIRVTNKHGLFNFDRYNKTGRITRVNPTSSIITVEFEDGTTDYGYMSNAEVIAPALKEGDRVRVVAEDGGVFLSRFEGKEGTVVSVDHEDETVTVEFDCGNRDYGNFTDVVRVDPAEQAPRKANETVNGWIENKGTRPVPEGTLIDVKYKDGLVMLNVRAGASDYGDSKVLEGTGKARRYARAWSLGNSAGTITHYRLALPVSGLGAVRIEFADMKKGMKVRYMGQPVDGGHTHWGFELGKIYDCVDGGVRHGRGCDCRTNYGEWRFELVTGVEGLGSLSEQLAALRSQLNAIKTEKRAAEAEVAAARTKVNDIEARRVALVATMTQHGIQFIAE